MRLLLPLLALVLPLLAWVPPVSRAQTTAAPAGPVAFHLELVSADLRAPVQVTHAGDGSNRLFVVEQDGAIWILRGSDVSPAPFLDVHDLISTGDERGLLGIAFPPDFAASQRFYVNYTDRSGATVIARYHVPAATPDLADPTSAEVLLTIPQPYPNHNGGQIAFGPVDGYLYIGMGDGGSGGDPENHAQRPDSLLGKMLRIDVESGADPYAIPPTNPFTQTAGTRGEIWATGLRNPWRFSFDRLTGDLWIGDVGQSAWEEVNYQPAASLGGENYGWRLMEGLHCYNPAACDPTGLTLPVFEYDHGLGCAVTGGAVYRGDRWGALAGRYLFGDFCSGRIWSLHAEPGSAVWTATEMLDSSLLITSFGEDEQGELYVTDHRGALYLLAAPASVWLPLVHHP